MFTPLAYSSFDVLSIILSLSLSSCRRWSAHVGGSHTFVLALLVVRKASHEHLARHPGVFHSPMSLASGFRRRPQDLASLVVSTPEFTRMKRLGGPYPRTLVKCHSHRYALWISLVSEILPASFHHGPPQIASSRRAHLYITLFYQFTCICNEMKGSREKATACYG